MDDLTPYEIGLTERMTPQHRLLMARLTPAERKSMAENVTPDTVNVIQSWIGADHEIEELLFWDRGGKFDDPEWQDLAPWDDVSALLHEHAKNHYKELKREAIENQRRSDLALFSQFNSGLLFTGVAGAVRCNRSGLEDREGSFFRGVELRCIGSIEELVNSITIYPLGLDQFEIHLGARFKEKPAGICVYSGDLYSSQQLSHLIDKDLFRLGFEASLKDRSGKPVSIDTRAMRRAIHRGDSTGFDDELVLYASAKVVEFERAFRKADELCRTFYARFGLETECYKIGKKYGNFAIVRDDNFDKIIAPRPTCAEGLIFITASLVCRRCRREIREFRDFAKSYPEVTAALVNLGSPQSKFYERVFADMAGGDVNRFRKTAVGVTPFIIVYSADEKGVLHYREYISTGKAEKPPSLMEQVPRLLDAYFCHHPISSEKEIGG